MGTIENAIEAGLLIKTQEEKKLSKPVLIMDPPGPDDEGEYILAVYKEAGPFGATVMYAIDSLVLITGATKSGIEVPWYYQGFYKDKKGNNHLRVQFPALNDYMLVERSKVRALSKEEFRAERKAELLEAREHFGSEVPEELLTKHHHQQEEVPGYL